jgi:NADH dehydrogenase [ubiquinone] 1 alpha subcomplex assembly factor 1
MEFRILLSSAIVFMASPAMSEEENRMLFSFETTDAARLWQSVNDGVMGGRSDGRFQINKQHQMEFYGTLSLENNGGFASVRSRGNNFGLKKDDVIFARVRGDGREYNLNLYTQDNSRAFSYRQSFKTKKDEWIEIKLPMDKFVATWRGRVFSKEPFDPTRVNGLGILLGDKKAGRFKLEIDWVKVISSYQSP